MDRFEIRHCNGEKMIKIREMLPSEAPILSAMSDKVNWNNSPAECQFACAFLIPCGRDCVATMRFCAKKESTFSALLRGRSFVYKAFACGQLHYICEPTIIYVRFIKIKITHL